MRWEGGLTKRPIASPRIISVHTGDIEMEKFAVIRGDGNPVKEDSLPSIIHMDIPQNEEEHIAQEREVVEYDRFLKGFRGVISNEIG